jgi:hypothetical protein
VCVNSTLVLYVCIERIKAAEEDAARREQERREAAAVREVCTILFDYHL